jgi:hypothetical protein
MYLNPVGFMMLNKPPVIYIASIEFMHSKLRSRSDSFGATYGKSSACKRIKSSQRHDTPTAAVDWKVYLSLPAQLHRNEWLERVRFSIDDCGGCTLGVPASQALVGWESISRPAATLVFEVGRRRRSKLLTSHVKVIL